MERRGAESARKRRRGVRDRDGRVGRRSAGSPGVGVSHVRDLARPHAAESGAVSEAAAVLEGRFEMEEGRHAAAVLDAAGIVALGKLAIHTGDRRQLRRLTEIAHVMFERGTPAVRKQRHGCSPGRMGRRPGRGCAPVVARAEGDERGHPAAVPAGCRRRGAADEDRAGRARRRPGKAGTRRHTAHGQSRTRGYSRSRRLRRMSAGWSRATRTHCERRLTAKRTGRGRWSTPRRSKTSALT